jgi:hypothetical protein
VGRHDLLLDVDALQDPTHQLFGAEDGSEADRVLMLALVAQEGELAGRARAALNLAIDVPAAYGLLATMLLLLLKEGGGALAPVDFNSQHLQPVLQRLGMQGRPFC